MSRWPYFRLPAGRRMFLLTFLLGLALMAPGAFADAIGVFDLSSLGITAMTGPAVSGTEYSFDFNLTSLGSVSAGPGVTGAASFGYLNLLGSTGWLIENEPIPLVDDVLTEGNHFWFGSSFTPMNVYAILSDTPYTSTPVPDASWSAVTGLSAVSDYGANDLNGEAGGPAPPPSPPPPAVPVIEGYLRGGVPDLKQLDNECGPTSTTNSILWLVKKYKLPTDKLPKKPDGSLDQQKILDQLAVAMKPGFDPATPVKDNNRGYPGLQRGELEAGKETFVKNTGLPLTVSGGVKTVDAQGSKAFSFVEQEMDQGEDVEFLIQWPDDGGFHWVTVTGYVDAGKDKKTLIVHNSLDANGNQYWKLKDDGTFVNQDGSVFGTASRAVGESPTPEPSPLALTTLALAAILLNVKRSRARARTT